MNPDDIILPRDLPLWHDARPYLDVRNNDEHTIVAYGLARSLLAQIPEADERIVLPAILLHDVGWKRIPEDLLLLAIGRYPSRKDLVHEHERHSVEIARTILETHRPDGVDIDAVLAIIDGHDTTREARSIHDAVLKDADKGWRTTPHGMRTIAGWYDVPVSEVLLMLRERSNPMMLTAPGRALAEANTAAVAAEQAILHYLGHGPEFPTFTATEGAGQWLTSR
ncbi:MAG: HD domain-containing protein [Rhodobacter sp.]|uniref:HD domain-containing protein n=1 Tax=Pararhodobacter sp. TaxID=2127056 RepID=UPI001D81B1F2|nr:HD domain-containing protein [Pararhodobacter sp.]MCB1343969.1 HD domain-containing protein [Paracoccaceae bacterium]MCC0073892.1 HD domain-containing protein [Rhodobacter sp.]HPD93882.1 HD domain-containing protein [Pararhodobacter sp.]